MPLDRNALVALDNLAEEADVLAARIVERLGSSDIEGARSGRLSLEELRPAVVTSIRGAVEAIRNGRAPTDEELAAAAALGELRARQGFSLEGMLLGLRMGAREALDAVQRMTVEAGVDTANSVALAGALWDWVDSVSAEMASGHRRVELAIARQDQQQRAAFVHGLVFGSLSAQRLTAGAAAYGLDLELEHRAVRVRPTAEHPVEALERSLRPSIWSEGLIGAIDGDLAAILPRLPDEEIPVPAGVGPPTALSGLSRSFELASHALETAIAFEAKGYQELGDLGLHPAVLAEEEIGESLVSRYVEPVLRLGAFGEDVLRSLRVFIDHEQHIEASAKVLIVHPNTLRHRLSRFEQETGANLRDVEHLTEVWWALSRQQLEQRRGASGQEHRASDTQTE